MPNRGARRVRVRDGAATKTLVCFVLLSFELANEVGVVDAVGLSVLGVVGATPAEDRRRRRRRRFPGGAIR
jgi:hypothetical protein